MCLFLIICVNSFWRNVAKSPHLLRVDKGKLRAKNLELVIRLESVWGYLKKLNAEAYTEEEKQVECCVLKYSNSVYCL